MTFNQKMLILRKHGLVNIIPIAPGDDGGGGGWTLAFQKSDNETEVMVESSVSNLEEAINHVMFALVKEAIEMTEESLLIGSWADG